MRTTRREFIRNGLTFLSFGMMAPSSLVRAAAELTDENGRSKAGTGNILVVLQMFGGNDGLNTLIPYTNPLYYQNRPTIGIPKDQVLPISNSVGLHPSMSALRQLFEKGHVAVVQGVGYPNPNFSHFRSQEIWQTADPVSTVVREGWLGRYFDDDGHLRENPLAGINIGGELPRALYSDFGSVVSMQNPNAFQLQTIAPAEHNAEIAAFTALYSQGTMANSTDDLVRKLGLEAYTCSERIRKALQAEANQQDDEPGSPTGRTLDAPSYVGRTGQMSPLARNLHTIAQLIKADLGTKIFYVSTGGFDTHANQFPTQARLLQDLSDSLAAFYAELEQIGVADRVTLVTFSEFGRRVQENASGGTDHGAGSCLFVMGGAVRGGFYGEYPPLDDLYLGNLKFNVDFRQVYATLLDKWLGVSSQKILNGSFTNLPLFA
ncbi:hypothetical protein CWRG_01164 [Chthonomonas calidirosea]|uniref:Uncharacterized protein conserved in bacteria n=1 Tax=Chthonomonas calidirosea (strain DSM 23976 / ICMP 18418 / T49) TaxID=1303518 RepID=S0F087_CHTCT|nr:DUF1501 domain-containing protein [Chthonomonas calidirosea]CCW36693.1 Uncharacterized protein conserved in bacteria [Chthonomonas calidirosea T49]CEK15457.1 hypothetical protein CWRG_01164 [Chthonomonas calidirosea]CEK15468.1 hypothetical protein CP488_01180 [Chthonomonas calidirosea]CEK16572.1 hypothetical protein CTKA_01180 [Chthonomonas calidirosea]